MASENDAWSTRYFQNLGTSDKSSNYREVKIIGVQIIKREGGKKLSK